MVENYVLLENKTWQLVSASKSLLLVSSNWRFELIRFHDRFSCWFFLRYPFPLFYKDNKTFFSMSLFSNKVHRTHFRFPRWRRENPSRRRAFFSHRGNHKYVLWTSLLNKEKRMFYALYKIVVVDSEGKIDKKKRSWNRISSKHQLPCFVL